MKQWTRLTRFLSQVACIRWNLLKKNKNISSSDLSNKKKEKRVMGENILGATLDRVVREVLPQELMPIFKQRCVRKSKPTLGFPGGAVVESPPANAGDAGSSPGPGWSHMLRSSWARVPQLLSLHSRACTPRARAPQERPLWWEAPALRRGVAPTRCN